MKIYLTVDQDSTEKAFEAEPKLLHFNGKAYWKPDHPYLRAFLTLPKGTIEKLTGLKRTWRNGPYEYSTKKEDSYEK